MPHFAYSAYLKRLVSINIFYSLYFRIKILHFKAIILQMKKITSELLITYLSIGVIVTNTFAP